MSLPAPPTRLGRKRDPSRDGAILDAAIEVLAETGYAGMTMDMVAERARAGKATLYRRWPSKVELVLDAWARMDQGEVDLEALPDTGSFRGDMLALMDAHSATDDARRLQVMGGLVTLLHAQQVSAEVVHATISGRWAAANRALIARAVARGEFPLPADLEALAQATPAMAAYRMSIQRRPLDRAFLLSIIDGVLLPALRGGGAQ